MRSTSVSKIARRTLWSSRSRSKRGLGATAPAGSSASIAARCARSAASSPRTASRLPSPSRSSSWWRPRAVPRTGLSRTSRDEAGLDEVVEARRRAGRARPPARGAAGSWRWVDRSRAANLRCAARRARRRGLAWWRPTDPVGSGGRGGGTRARLGERRPGRGDGRSRCRRRSRRSGSRRGPARADTPPSATSRARRAARNAARSRSTLNRTKFVRTRSGSSGPGAGWAVPPAATMPSIAGQGLGQAAGVGVVLGEAVDHPVRAVGQGDEAGRGEDPGLAHPATDHLAGPARAPDDVARPDDDRADRAGEALRQAERDGVGRVGQVRRRGRPGRRPRSRTGRRRCGAGRRGRGRSSATSRV